ncbi:MULTISPECIES: hypothetical protein [Paenibacillus]|uniref:Uncharacterized protein n=1 Tax=Paenibacillus odorifer TaxID=189426 RepID=A0A1R0X0S0_9BACL|nr:hypothetical protein [Paenibacillus odorifer]OMD26257.1 hypothetical protein BJP51_27645 [Paenibacillus odorifer]OME28859.1 hypothetical protein BSK63_23390 [Paenibacillus odorifer]
MGHKNKENPKRKFIPINTSDPRVNGDTGRILLECIEKPNPSIKLFVFISKWDRLLGFKFIRFVILTIPTLILLPNNILGSATGIFGISDPLLSAFPKLNDIITMYVHIYTWITFHPWILNLLLYFIFLLSFPVAITNFLKHDEKSNQKITLRTTSFTFLDLITAFGAIKYMYPSMQTLLMFLLYVLTVLTLLKLRGLKKYQKEHGPFIPSHLLKQARRKAKK